MGKCPGSNKTNGNDMKGIVITIKLQTKKNKKKPKKPKKRIISSTYQDEDFVSKRQILFTIAGVTFCFIEEPKLIFFLSAV
jgi:hypothetical protein